MQRYIKYTCYFRLLQKTALFLLYTLVLNQYTRASEPDSSLSLTFNFNNHDFTEKNNQVQTTPVGAMLVEDRFGNSHSAMMLNGTRNSYLNLGSTPLLKPKNFTLSLWVNIAARVYAGRGYDANPILLTKNGPGEDFIFAYAVFYNPKNNRFGAVSTKDSLNEAILNSVNEVGLNRWYHLAVTADNRQLLFYVNGKLQGQSIKEFETQFLSTDSVLVGHTGSKKNERFTFGIIDDIQIFHRVLNEQEIIALYHAPDPNRLRSVIRMLLKWTGIAAAVFATAFLLVWRRRRQLKKTRAQLEQNRKMHEMEIRTLKAQMNPHFIFNSLNSIQQLIMQQKNAPAEKYLVKFSKLMRELLESNTRESVSVTEEISILNGYLEMESLRFGDTFSYCVEAHPKLDTEHIFIPHLMVQPFAENAVWHGLLPKNDHCRLHILFEPHTVQTIRCTVTDNGVGMNSSISGAQTFKKKSLALSLVKQRLSLFAETMDIQTSVQAEDINKIEDISGGTRVTLVLPILKR